jgi:DNA polymerase elongation subunit (family B)
MSEINFNVIEQFIAGKDEQKYIVAIEAPNNENKAYLIINDPESGKRVEIHAYKPFLWMKEVVGKTLYNGNRSKLREAMLKYGIKIEALRIQNDEGYIPARMSRGFKYLVTCSKTPNDLIMFFKQGGFDPYNKENSRLIMRIQPAEQFLIQTGKRMFKGMDDYDDLHRFQFDLETEGLNPETDAIFQIGLRDNKGFELVLETIGETQQERRDSERLNIVKFANEVMRIKPDIIAGYNSENFDWDYFEKRCQRLGLEFDKLLFGFDGKTNLKRIPNSTLKLGNETERYTQTTLWGTNILDTSHAVRRAQAINSDIKSWGLKYITKFSKINKKNRVYVDGDKIHSTWVDTRDYWFNDEDGSWGLLEGSQYVNELPEPLKIVKGDYIVQRYLLDDLWETEKVDAIYNQASFLLAKLLPTSYMRSSTMGTAGQWTLILLAWSYENGLGIPDYEPKRDFTGGLSRLLETGFAEDVAKLDYAALYPKTTLTYDIFPDLDISGVMKGLLKYVVDTRDTYKALTGEYKYKSKQLKESNASEEEIEKASKLASDYDKKQLPLKILANSFYGSFGAPYIFPWGDSMCAEKITCMSRQNLRLLVRVFKEKYNLRPLVMDTDGVNFALPKTINEIKYVAKGNHWKTKDKVGVELIGLDACVSFFNETYMDKWMGLDVDDVCTSTINFKRKNYANLIDGKVKLVGNSIKSKKMPTYIEEFLDKGIRLLLDGKGHEFIEHYNEYVDMIYNYRIPLVKIASKAKVKESIDEYLRDCKTKTKAGNYKARKAHMELVLEHDLNPNLGEVIYYVNTGETKSKGDVTVTTDKETGHRTVTLNCKLIPQEQIETNPELTTDEYNAPRYLNALNKRITPLLVCFSEDIRDKILIDMVKDNKTKKYVLTEKSLFTESQCKLVAGYPLKPEDQDSYEELMQIEDKEIKFWLAANEVPNNMSKEEWEIVKNDYEDRIKEEKQQRLSDERDKIIEIAKRLEVNDLNLIKSEGKIPDNILLFADVNSETLSFVSKEYGESIIGLDILFKYEYLAKLRNEFYRKLFPFIETPSALYGKWTMFIHKIKDTTIKSELTTDNCQYWIDKVVEMGYDDFLNMSIGEITDLWVDVLSGSTESNSTDNNFDDSHATDMVLNEMIESFDEEEIDEIMGNKDSDDIMSLVKNEMMNISESEIL